MGTTGRRGISALWPGLPLRARVIVAAVVAAPLALGLLWERISTLKAFGVEISLANVLVIDPKLVAALMEQQYFSGAQHLIEQIRSAVLRPGITVVEVNLRTSE